MLLESLSLLLHVLTEKHATYGYIDRYNEDARELHVMAQCMRHLNDLGWIERITCFSFSNNKPVSRFRPLVS
jgi:hypothetical protein